MGKIVCSVVTSPINVLIPGRVYALFHKPWRRRAHTSTPADVRLRKEAHGYIERNSQLTGNLEMNSPSWMCASVPQTPQQVTVKFHCFSSICARDQACISPLRSTSSGPTCGIGTSLISKFLACIRTGGIGIWFMQSLMVCTYSMVPKCFHSSGWHTGILVCMEM